MFQDLFKIWPALTSTAAINSGVAHQLQWMLVPIKTATTHFLDVEVPMQTVVSNEYYYSYSALCAACDEGQLVDMRWA